MTDDLAATCEQCAHPTDAHELRGYANPDGLIVEGWAICPVDGCACWGTWALADHGSSEGAQRAYERWQAENPE